MDTPNLPVENVAQMPLKTLGLRPGMALQTRRLVEGAIKKESQFLGAIESKGVMVGPQGSEGEDTGLTQGEVCIVRGFTGQHEFSFLSKVLQVFQQPFVYALLAYPSQVDVRTVRQSMRTKTSWPVSAQTLPKPGVTIGELLLGSLVDISLQGAMVCLPTNMGTVGDSIRIVIEAIVENVPTQLTLSAVICHTNKSRADETYFVGMAFRNLTQQDKLVLHYLTKSPSA
jgi:c-di-GMP-binding flagellar brake protein YcgR